MSALIGVGRKEAERAARRPTGLERAVTWDGRGASGDGEERGAAHLPARGIPVAGQGPAGRREAYRELISGWLLFRAAVIGGTIIRFCFIIGIIRFLGWDR